jgi:hypothetical protein
MAEERGASGIVTFLAVIGLVFGIIGLLASLIPVLGMWAVYIALPAAALSLLAIVVGVAKKAKRSLAIAAFAVSLAGVVVSWGQLKAIQKVGDLAGEATHKLAKVVDKQGGTDAKPSQGAASQNDIEGEEGSAEDPLRGLEVLPGKVATCAVASKYVGSGPNHERVGVLPADPGVASERFPYFSSNPCVFREFRLVDDLALNELDVGSFAEGILRTTGNRVFPGVAYANIRGFESMYNEAKSMDKFALAEKRPEFINRLKSLRDDYAAEYARLTKIAFWLGPFDVGPVKDDMYDVNKQTLTLNFWTESDGSLAVAAIKQGMGVLGRGGNGRKDMFDFKVPLAQAKAFMMAPDRKYATTIAVQNAPDGGYTVREAGFIVYANGVEVLFLDFTSFNRGGAKSAITEATDELRRERAARY